MPPKPEFEPGWKGLDGTLYTLNDERLHGYGNPPNDPYFQTNNHGRGCWPLSTTLITVDANGVITEAAGK
ncbi:MAG TPA: hypothetical protein VKA67_02235 [Verrucomicrobiae bacterium]|nr:hypothetical protein [Verrucomicrobiae bacterium]